LFMAVPTVYAKMIQCVNDKTIDPATLQSALKQVRGMRLMVSGSAALPTPVLHSWRALTGHQLLERYGMTEIGMALSNPLHGTRREGFVGRPLPYVQCRIVPMEDQGGGEREGEEGTITGELRVKVLRSSITRSIRCLCY
jgi:malonyl-CoA/methylmalonyl-CoA synthetase